MTPPDVPDDPVETAPPVRYCAGYVVGGKYVLEQRLGDGPSSGVWRARNVALGSGVALKLLRDAFRAPGAVEDLLGEARLEASLQQPGVVRVFDVEQTEQGDAFIAMELLEGQTLAGLLQQRGRIEAVEAVRMLLPVIAVLTTVHARGAVHGNLEASNIILVPLGDVVRPTLVDFESTAPASPAAQVHGYASDASAVCRILREASAGRAVEGGDPPRGTATQRLGAAALEKILRPGSAGEAPRRAASIRELGIALAQFLLTQGVSTDASGAEVAQAWLRSKPSRSGTTPPPVPPQARPSTPASSLA